MSDNRIPWAFVAHKDGFWAGLASARLPRHDLTKFLGEFASEGFTISTVHDRAEYDALLLTLQPWPERPRSRKRDARQTAMAV